uniref:DUF3615 domain-containing protein n=1 Tax=Leersia perrieri TaxID=77586 RepID=A0A0D9WRH0_9ORYZ
MYAEAALEHYNADANNMVKYELVKAIISGAIFTCRAGYGHVNFIARPASMASGSSSRSQEEQLFFAEVRGERLCPDVPVVSRRRDWPENMKLPEITSPSPRNYCFLCSDKIKHPKDGTSYHAGHCYEVPE